MVVRVPATGHKRRWRYSRKPVWISDREGRYPSVLLGALLGVLLREVHVRAGRYLRFCASFACTLLDNRRLCLHHKDISGSNVKARVKTTLIHYMSKNNSSAS